jgi:4-hydroxybenzoate polyprenyltransferase
LNQSLPEEIAVDIANGKSYRPTVRGMISPNEAKGFAFLLFLMGVIVSFQTNILFGLSSLTIVFFAFFYTMPPLRAKKHFLFSNIWQGIARGFLPVVSVWTLSPQPFHPFPLALGFVIAVWCCGAQATKDLSDVPGDSLYGIRTFFVVLGKERAIRLIGMLMAFSFMTLILFIVGGILPVNYLWLSLLSLPSIFILKTLRNPITLQLLENQLSWVLFYAILGLFYALSAVLVRPC